VGVWWRRVVVAVVVTAAASVASSPAVTGSLTSGVVPTCAACPD
jgi:hypothetical protein